MPAHESGHSCSPPILPRARPVYPGARSCHVAHVRRPRRPNIKGHGAWPNDALIRVNRRSHTTAGSIDFDLPGGRRTRHGGWSGLGHTDDSGPSSTWRISSRRALPDWPRSRWRARQAFVPRPLLVRIAENLCHDRNRAARRGHVPQSLDIACQERPGLIADPGREKSFLPPTPLLACRG